MQPYFIIVLLIITGFIIGSFLNVCIYRIPRGLSIIKPRSFCTSCKTQLKFWHNIPLFSYFLLKGKCYFCNSKISLRYPIVEALIPTLFILLYYSSFQELSIHFFFSSIFLTFLVLIAFIDYEHMIIPDILIYPLAILGIIYNLIEKKFFSALLGGIIGGSVLGIIAIFSWLILKKEAMGWGDVKFSSGLGLFLGWERLIYALIFAFIIGGVIAFILLITRIKKRGDYIPFGPFLSAGGTLSVLLNFPQNFFIL